MHLDIPLGDVKADTNQTNLVPRVFSLAPRESPGCAGHVAPKMWEPKIRQGKKSK